MTAHGTFAEIAAPTTLEAAVAALGGGAVPIAGATWIMRAPLRHEPVPAHLVSLRGLQELHGVDVGPEFASVGAMVTHEGLGVDLAPHSDLFGIATAARASANPGVRRIATLGGNVATRGFAASDLTPALLAADASVVVATDGGLRATPMDAFLSARDGAREAPGRGGLIVRIEIARSAHRAAHARLTMRKAGDYPCAIVSVSVGLDAGIITDVRIAVGAVEATARRWTVLEDRLKGMTLDPSRAEAAARASMDGFAPREGVDAPGWYRLSVLPVLVRRAFGDLQAEA